MFTRGYILALLISVVLPCLSFSQNEWAVRPKYAPHSDKDRNVMNEKGKQGVWKYYTRSRILIYKISYKDGIKHGPCTKFYSSNGIIREESQYFYGKRDSTFITYYNNGQISTDGMYTEGKKTGEWTTYFKSSGFTKSKGIYVLNRREGEWTFFSSKGYKLTSGKYVKGNKEGDWQIFTADGKVKETVKYIGGVAQLTEGNVVVSKKPTPKTNPKTLPKTPPKTPPKKTDTGKKDTTKAGPKEN